eukprot:COSAG02_NODE_10_length_59045_cov_19.973365_13_plen_132_part_00
MLARALWLGSQVSGVSPNARNPTCMFSDSHALTRLEVSGRSSHPRFSLHRSRLQTVALTLTEARPREGAPLHVHQGAPGAPGGRIGDGLSLITLEGGTDREECVYAQLGQRGVCTARDRWSVAEQRIVDGQ